MFYGLIYIILVVKCERIPVTTTIGTIFGNDDDGINKFLGIPYALVDINYPFGPSLDHPEFTKPFIADNSSINCPQLEEIVYKGTLQCLTLNIYTPPKHDGKDPVLVWFHGSFTHGSANDHPSPYLVRQKIILVTVNYRLGPYGFFCPNEHVLPGNQGMRDQQTALEWIHRHIADFGGNSKSVTIGGSGHGGGMVELHLYSKLNKPLFNKVIIQSGSIFSPGFFVQPDPKHVIAIAVHLGKTIGSGTNARDVLPFLHPKDPKIVLEAAAIINKDIGVCKEANPSSRGPNFITETPFRLQLPAKTKHIQFLIGYNSMEMLDMVAKNNTMAYYKDSGDIIMNILKKCFNLTQEKLESLSKNVKRFYFGDKSYGPETIIYLSEMISDFFVANSVERTVNRLSRVEAIVYKYLFSYKGTSKYKERIPESGVPQGEELKFLFDSKLTIFGPEQEEIRKNMVQMWSNFIKFGNPTPENQPISWKPVHHLTRPYLNIDTTMTMLENTFQRRITFWHALWDSYSPDSVLH